MLDLLIVLILLALAVCPAAPLAVLAAVPVAITMYPCAQIVRAESRVAARFAGDTARIGRMVYSKPRTRANAPTVPDARVVVLRGVAGALPIVSDLRIVGVVAAAGPGDLTVSAVV